MDPNSQHQLWSKWIASVRPSGLGAPTFATVQANCARFLRKAFGTTAQARVRQFPKAWVIEVLAEGQYHPDHQDDFQALAGALSTFLRNGFGPSAQVTVKARLMAGARVDGLPPDQLLMLPTLRIPDEVRAALGRSRLSPSGVI